MFDEEPISERERQIQAELSGYFFFDRDIPQEYWLGGAPLDLTNLRHCQHLIWCVRKRP
jgi:hypothetical protein